MKNGDGKKRKLNDHRIMLSSLKEELDKADLNNMTPLQAFDLLRSMKEQLGIG